MATSTDVIRGALRLIGVLAIGQTPTAAEMSQALDALNDMLATWPDQGVDIDPSPVGLGEDLGYPSNHIAPIRYSLALELATEYEKPVSQVLAMKQNRYFRGLQAYYAAPALLSVDPALSPYYNPNSY